MLGIYVIILTAIVPRVAEELHRRIRSEITVAWNSEQEKTKLESLLLTLTTTLQEDELKTTYSEAMLQWLQKIHNTVDDAMILLQTKSAKRNHSIQNVLYTFEYLLKEKGSILRTKKIATPVAVEKRTDSSPPFSEIYERENAKEEIVKFLLDDTCHENVSVIPIVGIPGIGKTTIAKLVFNDQRVKCNFEKNLMIWVWISGGLDIDEIVKEILESASGSTRDYSNFHTMKKAFQELLHGRKFMLVLDNVFDEGGNWVELSSLLGGAMHGSKVVVTTSNNRVANMVKTTTAYNVKSLTESSCWLIFKSLAFWGGWNENTIFLEIGRKIANMSKGVPHAAEYLGRLMVHKKDPGEWHDAKSHEIWSLGEENQILPMLRLSYKDLPPEAYRCFAYCSIFPRNYEIDKDMIIKYWIALEFISSEEEGRDAFNHFFNRFFFEPLRNDENGVVLTFKLHELVYDLARYEMKTSINRHFCSDVKTTPDVPKEVPDIKYLRTYSLLNFPPRYIS